VGLTAVVVVGCSSGGEGSVDGWIPQTDRADPGDSDPGRVDTFDARETVERDATGEIVCGEPGQVVETIPEAAKLAPCDVYRGTFRFRLGGTN